MEGKSAVHGKDQESEDLESTITNSSEHQLGGPGKPLNLLGENGFCS